MASVSGNMWCRVRQHRGGMVEVDLILRIAE